MTNQEHLLICLMEECGEVAQACAKALRFGLDDVHQAGNPDIVSPRKYIQKELCDLFGVCQLLTEAEVLAVTWDAKMIQGKIEKLRGFMEYARSRGTLE